MQMLWYSKNKINAKSYKVFILICLVVRYVINGFVL